MQQQRIIFSIVGHALGEAVGAQYQGNSATTAPIQFPYESVSIKNAVVNGWLDKTDSMLVLMESLTDDNPQMALAAKLQALVTSDRATTTPVLKTLVNATNFTDDPVATSRSFWEASGNKLASNMALGRCTPLAALSSGNVPAAEQMCIVTDADPRCVASNVFVVSTLNQIIYNEDLTAPVLDGIVASGIKLGLTYVTDKDEFVKIIHGAYTGKNIAQLSLAEIGKSSHVYKTLSAVAYALQVIRSSLEVKRLPNFKKVIAKIASAGGDTSCNCALVGAFISSYTASLPDDWLKSLVGQDIIIDVATTYANTIMAQ
jgi:ADP-ribosylglycohydrolase